MIGIQQPRLRRGQALVRKLQDFPDDRASRREGTDLVSHAQRVARTGRLAVDAHVVRFASRLGKCARFEQARSKQEAIESHRLRQRFTSSASLNAAPVRLSASGRRHDDRASGGRRRRFDSHGRRRRWKRLGALEDRREPTLQGYASVGPLRDGRRRRVGDTPFVEPFVRFDRASGQSRAEDRAPGLRAFSVRAHAVRFTTEPRGNQDQRKRDECQ